MTAAKSTYPTTLPEQNIYNTDLDYLGRTDFHKIGSSLLRLSLYNLIITTKFKSSSNTLFLVRISIAGVFRGSFAGADGGCTHCAAVPSNPNHSSCVL